MAYIDILIPLLLGILAIASPETLVKDSVPDAMKKRSLLRKAGYILVLAAIIYGVVKLGAD